jgi:hypothetical protein
MRKVLLAGALALAAVTALPDRSHAWGRDAYNSHGYGWLGSFAFRKMQWIHSVGPLYNYGPYDVPGNVTHSASIPWHGVYIPADPNIGHTYGYTAPGYAGAAQGAPAHAPPARPHAAPPAHAPHAMTPPRVVPAGYQHVYPAWLNYR